VLVTRAQPGADETAGRLTTLGFAPVIAPMFVLRAAAHDAHAGDAADILALTSAMAVQAWTGRRDLPAYCVGDATAAQARAAGFQNVVSADGDGRALADRIARETHGAVLHVRGAVVAFDIAADLQARGRRALSVVVYAAAAADGLPAGALEGLAAALFHSPAGAERFALLAASTGEPSRLSAVRALCLSAQIAVRLSELQFKSVEIADRPTETALLALLTSAQG